MSTPRSSPASLRSGPRARSPPDSRANPLLTSPGVAHGPPAVQGGRHEPANAPGLGHPTERCFMKLDSLKPLLDHDGPLTTVSLDVTRPAEAGDRDIRSRWNGLRRTLEQQGTPGRTIDALADAVLRPTHVPGPHGRFVVASGEGILFDRVLASP